MDALAQDEKTAYIKADIESTSDSDASDILDDPRDIITRVISVEDDPTLSPWTFRAFFIGIGLSAFGGVLGEIYYFKPRTVGDSTLFLAILAYVIGVLMDTLIPRRGWFRYLNPGPFNKKEAVFIVIMVSAASGSALGTEVLAVQRLYYDITPNAGASIFLLFSSQLLGYGIGGLMRSILLYPSKMLYPGLLPLVSMLQAFFKDGGKDNGNNRKRMKVFKIGFSSLFIWEIFPEWMFPLLTGFSVFCLANPTSPTFTRIFGGSNGNEDLGLLSICLDWQYISGDGSPLATPLRWQVHFASPMRRFIGNILCIIVIVIVYYKNIWGSRNFPFLSQELFYENGTVYDQTLILNDNLEVDPVRLQQQGLPFYAGTWLTFLLTSNMAMAATFTHLMLWNRSDLSAAWSWATPKEMKKMWANFNWKFWQDEGIREVPGSDEDIDPHYREMLKYPDVPNSWYMVVLVLSFVTALVIIYKTHSTLPWWGFVVACSIGSIFTLFFGSLSAMTGLGVGFGSFVQMVGGFLHPGKPMANMYFVLFSSNAVGQALFLLCDLKLAQYVKLPPRAAFTAQIIGTLLGCILNYSIMNSIIDSQRSILLSVEGTNIWSGQQPQSYNSQAIIWGGLSHELFTAGKRYQWVMWAYVLGLLVPIPFWVVHRYFPKLRADYFYTPIILYYVGWLCVGINSSVMSYFLVGYFSQWFLRTRYPKWFIKYNYVLSAAMDGGTQVMVFVLSFAVQGAAGKAHLFPQWWGANQNGNYDRCATLE
ncbi:OPT oligopeptide transporter [Artomyces pyxidatus]|uniref:OPT oligopeptide transporter n=1 Tax=Artomyces pyxidatus TaxID=48021 RepID=A0ACB8SQE1_9AGAM|nr:OPT oligopeptide transporter [Artomyces pyxidatus]